VPQQQKVAVNAGFKQFQKLQPWRPSCFSRCLYILCCPK